jgi:hypothetical protein
LKYSLFSTCFDSDGVKKLLVLFFIQRAACSLALEAQPKPTIEGFADMLIKRLYEERGDMLSRVDFTPDSSGGFKRELDLRLYAALSARRRLTSDSTRESLRPTLLRYEVQFAKTTIEAENDVFIRTLTLSSQLNMHGDSGVWTKTFLIVKRDTLLEQEIELISDLRFPETRFETPRRFFSRAVIPTLATASLGLMVYLFFSVRSN